MGWYKGSQEASNAAKKAHVTRKLNKLKYNYRIPYDVIEKKKAIVKPKPELVYVEDLKLSSLKDSEAFVLRTDGPTKITYSSKYKTLRISPLCTILTKK